jgi:tetratricopeptide (TPR) repeat protein
MYRRQGNAYNVQRRMDEMFAVYEKASSILGTRTVKSTHEWIDLQLDRIWACYWTMRMPELSDLLGESGAVIEEHGTLVQKARWFESLVLIDFRRYRYYQLPYETLENAKKQVEVAWASRNRRVLGRATTILGFVHLWRDELKEAEQNLLNGLKDVEAVGDIDTQLINFNYMALIGRKRGDVKLTQEWAQRTLTLADKANNIFYKIPALGSLAWVHFHSGNEQQGQAYLQEALALDETVSSPIRFMVIGPALAIEVQRKNWEAAVKHVEALLHPSQQKLADEIQSILEQAIVEWKVGNIEATQAALVKGIELMKQKKLGYM